MAVKLASNEVTDLCIGKPPVRVLLPSATTVGDSLAALRRNGKPHLAVISDDSEGKIVGKFCISDVLCFLCAGNNLTSPAAALDRSITAFLPKDGVARLVCLVDPHLRVLEVLDIILGGAQNIVLPVASHAQKKPPHRGGDGSTATEFCWLTHEDLIRYFLNSISLFSPIPTLSIDALGLVSTGALVIRDDEPGLSVIPLLRHAISDETAVAVVTAEGLLVGEISLVALSACGKMATMAAAVATLTAGSLVSLIDHRGSPSGSLVSLIKERLKEKGLRELLELMEEEVSSWSSWGSGSSSDEESGRERRPRSFFNGRQAAEPEVCHPGSSLVAVMVKALANQVSYMWVVEEDNGLIGIVTFTDMLRVFRDHLHLLL